jgi:hypothetical protein
LKGGYFVFDKTESPITGSAEKPSDFASLMVVINTELGSTGIRFPTASTYSILFFKHPVVVIWRYVVIAFQLASPSVILRIIRVFVFSLFTRLTYRVNALFNSFVFYEVFYWLIQPAMLAGMGHNYL